MVASFKWREARRITRGHLRIAWPVVMPRDDLLPLRAVQIAEVRPRDLARAAPQGHLLDHRHRRLGENADRGHHDLEFVGAQLAHREQRLVLPGHQHIPESTLHESDRRAASTGVEHRHVLVQPSHELPCARLIAPRLRAGPGPGGQIVPAGAAGGLGVGCDHRHAGAHQIAPVVNSFRVAVADQEHDGGGIGRAVLRQQGLPVQRQELRVSGDRIDVGRQRERHHIRGEPVDHRARLLARAPV